MSRNNEGATMLVSVLVFVFIMSIVMLGVMQMVTSRAKRAVAWEDTNVTFFAAEASINDVFSRLLSSESWPPDWTGLEASDGDKYEDELVVNGVKVKRKLTYIENAESGDYIDIEIRAKGSRRSVRKVVGRYFNASSGEESSMNDDIAEIVYMNPGQDYSVPPGHTAINKTWGNGPYRYENYYNDTSQVKSYTGKAQKRWWWCKGKCPEFSAEVNKKITIGLNSDDEVKVIKGGVDIEKDLGDGEYEMSNGQKLNAFESGDTITMSEWAILDIDEDDVRGVYIVVRNPGASLEKEYEVHNKPSIFVDQVLVDHECDEGEDEGELVSPPCSYTFQDGEEGVVDFVYGDSVGVVLDPSEGFVKVKVSGGKKFSYYEIEP